MSQGRKVAQFQGIIARDVVGGANGREHLGLLYRVDAQVGFQIKIQIEHVRRIAGLLGNDSHHLHLNGIDGRAVAPAMGTDGAGAGETMAGEGTAADGAGGSTAAACEAAAGAGN